MNKLMTLTISAALLAAAAYSQPTQTPQPVSGGPSTTTAAPSLINVVSDPQWGATSPINQTVLVHFRAQMSNGLSTSDFRTMGLQLSVYTNDGVHLAPDQLVYDMATGTAKVTSDVPRLVYLAIFPPGVGLGYASVTISFYRPPFSVNLPVIDIASSQAQADDGTVPVLFATSPLTSPGPINLQINVTNGGGAPNANIYFPDGVVQGQKISLNVQNVQPLSLATRATYEVFMLGPSGNTIAHGFGSTIASIETRNIDASFDDSGNLVFTLAGSYIPTVNYTISILRGNQFRVELSQARGELYSYGQGGVTKVMFLKGSLAGNQFYLPVGSFTLSVNAIDTSSGIGWYNSRASGLNLNDNVILK